MDAAAMLRRARRSAGLSQAELAARSGVAQPVISAYERGARQPSVRALQRLLATVGKRLAVVDIPVDVTRNGQVLRDLLDLVDRLPQRRDEPLSFPARWPR
jgi:transcriptional regulator with XRE-family HTH domain